MNTKKLFSLLLCLLLLLPVIAGCKKNGEDVSDSSEAPSETQNDTEEQNTSADTSVNTSEESSESFESSEDSETQSVSDYLWIIKDGVSVDVVSSKYPSSGELGFINDITDALYKLGCKNVNTRTEEEGYDPNSVEIVIGSTDYAESLAVIDELGYSQGTIRINGNKLVIIAYDDDIYSSLAPKLSLALRDGKDDQDNVKIAKDYSVTISKNEMVSSLPVLEELPLNNVKDGGDSSFVLTFRNASADTLEGYANTLKQNGYEEYAKNQIEGNIYHTYTTEENVVTLIFTDYNDEFKVIIDKRSNTSLPTRESENIWTPVEGVTSTITQIGLLSDNGSGESRYNGQSYVIRLADGSFIIVDGGHDFGKDHDKLYNVLEKQSEGREIVIAAWFFTHDHGDHTGFFKNFCESYASKVTVEQFVYNFPALTDVKNGTGTVGGLIRKHFRASEVIKAHPGQQFYIRNAKINMLYTNDLWEHKKQALKTHNEASTVFTVELEGKKLIILGDYYDDRGILRNLYTSETLKSDIMQVSHHGISNCGSLLYPIIAPEWALWPWGVVHWISETED